jgi:hypothetical protein
MIHEIRAVLYGERQWRLQTLQYETIDIKCAEKLKGDKLYKIAAIISCAISSKIK